MDEGNRGRLAERRFFAMIRNRTAQRLPRQNPALITLARNLRLPPSHPFSFRSRRITLPALTLSQNNSKWATYGCQFFAIAIGSSTTLFAQSFSPSPPRTGRQSPVTSSAGIRPPDKPLRNVLRMLTLLKRTDIPSRWRCGKTVDARFDHCG